MKTDVLKGLTCCSESTSMPYRRELHRYLLRRLRNPHDVEDMAQEVYLRLFRRDEETPVQKPLAYLYGIASHVIADFRIESEKERAYVTVDSEAVEDSLDQPVVVSSDELADRLNLQQQIDKAFAKLPRTHAAVLLAHKRDGLSYGEVAEKLGLSIHTVEKYVTQSKAQIRMMAWER